jgi:signal transduction histidine kinase
MMGDPKLLFQVFSNLLSNAIKYSPNGGLIEISAEVHSQDVVVAIEDHGIGIPAQDLDRLFERYHRGSNVSGIVGTGVGLYLVKMVVDLHGGSVAVDSQEGRSRFTLRLPLKPPLQVAATAPATAEAASPAETQRTELEANLNRTS